jgi:hypothetical protein
VRDEVGIISAKQSFAIQVEAHVSKIKAMLNKYAIQNGYQKGVGKQTGRSVSKSAVHSVISHHRVALNSGEWFCEGL